MSPHKLTLTGAWASDIQRLATEWDRVRRPPPIPLEEWEREVARMAGVMSALKEEGLWSRGPHDLLSIVGLAHWELAHSAALAWLCDPEGSHGLGYSVLSYLTELCGGQVDPGPVEVITEETRSKTRADIVVRSPSGALVVEVKVNAREGLEQALRLHSLWHDLPGVRFLFITRQGYLPKTAAHTLRDWTSVSWREVRTALHHLTAAHRPGRGRSALDQYLQTLDSAF